METIPYGNHAFHEHASPLGKGLDCHPAFIGHNINRSKQVSLISNANRYDAEFLFHYTTKGYGLFRDDILKTESPVPLGTAFMIPLPSKTSYINVLSHEWECMWVFFNGEIAKKIVHKLIEDNGSYLFKQPTNGSAIKALFKLFQLKMSGLLHPANASGIMFEILQGLSHKDNEQIPENILRACRVVNQELSNPDLNVEMLAKTVSLSRFHFSRSFTRYMHCSPNAYIVEQRLQKAVDLIIGGQYKMKEVSKMVGFSDAGYFNSVFKKKYNLPPGKMIIK
jgi:AraC-like DNA-binding protein